MVGDWRSAVKLLDSVKGGIVVNKSPVASLDHIGLVVNDLDKAIEHFESLGMGPFKSPHEVHNVVIIETREGGKPIHRRVRIALGKMGPIMLQLLQPTEGEASVMRFLKATGGGIHHVAFSVDDLDKEKAVMEENGFKEVQRSVFKGNGGCLLFQGLDKGVVIELVQWPRTA